MLILLISMIDYLRNLAILVAVLENGSFKRGADALGLSPQVVSHHIANLEKDLDTALIYRSTRQISATQEGEALFKSAKAMLQEAEQGIFKVTKQRNVVKGGLKITVPTFFKDTQYLDVLIEFIRENPQVDLSVSFSDLRTNIIRDGFDLAIRVGDMEDSGLKSKKLFNIQRNIVGTKKYIDGLHKPKKPADLENMNWITLNSTSPYRELFSNDGTAHKIRTRGNISADNIEAVLRFVQADLGIASIPRYLTEDEINSGRFISLLPKYKIPSLNGYAVWPANVKKQSVVMYLVDYFSSKL